MEEILLLVLLAMQLAQGSIRVEEDDLISDEEILPLLGWGTGGGGWGGGSTTTSGVDDCVAIDLPSGGVNCSVVCPLLDPPGKRNVKLLPTMELSIVSSHQSSAKIGYYEHCCSTNGTETECSCCLEDFEECVNGQCQCSIAKCGSASISYPTCQGCVNNRCIIQNACPGSRSCVDVGKPCPSCENARCKHECKKKDPTSTACCNPSDKTCPDSTGNCLCCPPGSECSASIETSIETTLSCLCTGAEDPKDFCITLQGLCSVCDKTSNYCSALVSADSECANATPELERSGCTET